VRPQTQDARQSVILDAAMAIIEAGGVSAVSMSELAQKTGFSRPAIYQYFSSREHVLSELLINEMADLSNEIERIQSGVSDPLEKVRIWVHYSLAHLSSPEHKIVREISMETLPEEKLGMLRAMHGYFMASLTQPLSDLGLKDAASICGMIYGSLSATAERITSGADFTEQARALEKFVFLGIEAAIGAESSKQSPPA
jgi:AcrR family transcriptional regulator